MYLFINLFGLILRLMPNITGTSNIYVIQNVYSHNMFIFYETDPSKCDHNFNQLWIIYNYIEKTPRKLI